MTTLNSIEQELLDRDNTEDLDRTDSVIPPPDIVAFNEQRSCADIFRMCDKNQIDINPDFQRGEVWPNKAQTLFIDSLIKQLPIPSLCISLDIQTNKRLVIDGLQRITAINKFLTPESTWRLSKIDDVDQRIAGKSINELKTDNITLYERLENVSIPITVLRCDYNQPSHMEYLFQIFHRLNTGGNKLYNQEIRNCIFQGVFNDLLKKLAKTKMWLDFKGISEEKVNKARLANEEQILRFFMLKEEHNKYSGRLAASLNTYMKKYRNASSEQIESFELAFNNTIVLANKIDSELTSINVIDAVLIGIYNNIKHLENQNNEHISFLYKELLKEPEFSPEQLKEGLGAAEKVKNRIKKAIIKFGE